MIHAPAIDELLEKAVADGTLPGVIAVAGDRNGMIYEGVFGRLSIAGEEPVRANTMLAIASMTKAITSVAALQAVGVRVTVFPRLLEVVGSSVEFDELHGLTLMGVRRFSLARSSKMLKRAVDLLAAFLGLLVCSGLMVMIAIAIKLDGRGPVFFRQLRVGRNGRRLQMLKFRTMVPEAEALKSSLRGSSRSSTTRGSRAWVASSGRVRSTSYRSC